MASTHEGTDAAQGGAPAQPDNTQTSPTNYHLHGAGISVAYFPAGVSPVGPGRGPHLTYQDTYRSLHFQGEEIRTVEVPDLGTIVSVTLVETVDTGNTTFSVLLPHVVLPEQPGATAFIETKGITTVLRAFVALIGQAQREVYTVTRLRGTASHVLLA